MTEDEIKKVIEGINSGERRRNNTSNGTSFERHAQTVLTGLITLLLAGTGALLMGMNARQGDLVSDVKVLQEQVSNLSKTLTESTRTYVTRPELIPIELRLQQLEGYHVPSNGD